MSPLIVPYQGRSDFVVTDQNVSKKPFGPKFLCRTKTTAASINAKTKATVKAKIIAAAQSIAKAQTNSASTINNTSSNVAAKPSVKSTISPKSTAVGTRKSQISASSPKSKILDEIQKITEKNGKVTSKNKIKNPPKTIPKSNSSSTSNLKPPVNPKVNSTMAKPSTGLRKMNNPQNPATEKRAPLLPQVPLQANAQPKFKTNLQEQSQVRATKSPTTSKLLPPNYKSTKRKVTMAIVALPIVFVTSWVLFERLWLGKERKELVPPGMSQVNESKVDTV